MKMVMIFMMKNIFTFCVIIIQRVIFNSLIIYLFKKKTNSKLNLFSNRLSLSENGDGKKGSNGERSSKE